MTLFQNSFYTEQMFMGKVKVKVYCPHLPSFEMIISLVDCDLVPGF